MVNNLDVFMNAGGMEDEVEEGEGVVDVSVIFSQQGQISLYFGEMCDGLPDGFGIRIQELGIVDIGQWKDGKKHGWNREIRYDHSTHAEYVNGQKNGKMCVYL